MLKNVKYTLYRAEVTLANAKMHTFGDCKALLEESWGRSIRKGQKFALKMIFSVVNSHLS